MTVHLVSVGLSMLDALKDPRRKFGSDDALLAAVAKAEPHMLLRHAHIGDLDADRAKASDWLADALKGEDTPQAERLRAMAAAIRPQDWSRDISAELGTFARLPGRKDFLLGADDIVLLICSDTPDGLLAGAWNAIAIAGGSLDKIRYLPDPAQPLSNIRGQVVLVRVTGMDAGDKGFRQAMRGLGFLARELFSSGALRQGEEFRFVLSGGFKAAIPYLIGLAEAVRSVDDESLRLLGAVDLMPAPVPYPVTAFVQYQTESPDSPLVRLPLRRLVAAAVREEVSGYDKAGKRTGRPGSALLEGYAFEAMPPKWGKVICQLTPFGEGLSELFGTLRDDTGSG